MKGQTVKLTGSAQRALAVGLIARAPDNAIVNIKPETRSNDQNALLWVLLSQVSRSKPRGLTHRPDIWKCLFMSSFGHEAETTMGIDGYPIALGHQSSKLSVSQMRDLIEFIYSWGAQNGVVFDDNPNEIAMLEGMRA
jgi:hypothetical protein